MSKASIRKVMKNKRDQWTRDQIQRKSQELFQGFTQLPIYREAACIMCYVSIGSEVHTHAFIEQALQEDKKVVVPVTKPSTRELLLSQLLDFKEDLTLGHWGLLEPKKEAFRPVSSGELGLILVPGLAFTIQGFRLGYGGGYYDGFLSSLDSPPPVIGLSFEGQILRNLPVEAFDVPMDAICTEKRFIEAK